MNRGALGARRSPSRHPTPRSLGHCGSAWVRAEGTRWAGISAAQRGLIGSPAGCNPLDPQPRCPRQHVSGRLSSCDRHIAAEAWSALSTSQSVQTLYGRCRGESLPLWSALCRAWLGDSGNYHNGRSGNSQRVSRVSDRGRRQSEARGRCRPREDAVSFLAALPRLGGVILWGTRTG
jgi:hypothetical protein